MEKYSLIILIAFNILWLEAQQRTTICWDASHSMVKRDLVKELNFLESYFIQNPNLVVELIVFDISIADKQIFKIENGNWTDLKESLNNVVYDGATSYKSLDGNITGQTVFIFSDGIQNLETEKPKFNGDLQVVTANPIFNSDNLKTIAKLNNGSFVNIKNQEQYISNTKFYTLKINGDLSFLNNLKAINTNNKSSIAIKEFGEYQIEAKIDDIVIFTIDEKTLFERTLDETKILNIWIDEKDGSIQLDEIELTNDVPDAGDEELLTAVGIKSKRSIGYALQTVSNEDFLPAPQANNISGAISGKVAGLKLGARSDISTAVIRNGNSSISFPRNALIVIDGVPVSGGQLSNFVNPDNVLDFTVLKGLAATNRFGSDGNGGVILIRTKTGNSSSRENVENTALVKNNVYNEQANSSFLKSTAVYIKKLKKENSIEDAYKLYLKQRTNYQNTPEYYIDVYDFFKNIDQQLALLILSNILEEEASLMQLKTMLFKLNDAKNFHMSFIVAKKIKKDFPDRIQSYLDMALAHKNIGEYQEALNLLNGIKSGVINPDLDFYGLEKTVTRELKNIVFNHGKDLNLIASDKIYLETNNLFDARIIVEWSLEEAEFEIQFVNPTKRFFKWKHTLNDNKNRIKDELENGYSIEEFEIVGGDEIKGEWIINAKYLGNINNKEDIIYLKCTIYYNFGKQNQRVEQRTLRLKGKGSEEQLFKLRI